MWLCCMVVYAKPRDRIDFLVCTHHRQKLHRCLLTGARIGTQVYPNNTYDTIYERESSGWQNSASLIAARPDIYDGKMHNKTNFTMQYKLHDTRILYSTGTSWSYEWNPSVCKTAAPILLDCCCCLLMIWYTILLSQKWLYILHGFYRVILFIWYRCSNSLHRTVTSCQFQNPLTDAHAFFWLESWRNYLEMYVVLAEHSPYCIVNRNVGMAFLFWSTSCRFSAGSNIGEVGGLVLPSKESPSVEADVVNYGNDGLYFSAYNSNGFLLNSGISVIGPCAAFPRNAFCWNVCACTGCFSNTPFLIGSGQRCHGHRRRFALSVPHIGTEIRWVRDACLC